MPLMTPAVLRALGEAGAVPVRARSAPGRLPAPLLPSSERRVAGGELSLRGVNPTTLDVPEALLADADTPAALLALGRLAEPLNERARRGRRPG